MIHPHQHLSPSYFNQSIPANTVKAPYYSKNQKQQQQLDALHERQHQFQTRTNAQTETEYKLISENCRTIEKQ